jgi:hypothetical protein
MICRFCPNSKEVNTTVPRGSEWFQVVNTTRPEVHSYTDLSRVKAGLLVLRTHFSSLGVQNTTARIWNKRENVGIFSTQSC